LYKEYFCTFPSYGQYYDNFCHGILYLSKVPCGLEILLTVHYCNYWLRSLNGFTCILFVS
jgi:hypothetical protein